MAAIFAIAAGIYFAADKMGAISPLLHYINPFSLKKASILTSRQKKSRNSSEAFFWRKVLKMKIILYNM